MAIWTTKQIEEWLFDACRVLPEVSSRIIHYVTKDHKNPPGVALASMGLQDVRDCCKEAFPKVHHSGIDHDHEYLARSYWHAAAIFNEICLRKEFTEVYVTNANPYPWPYNGMLHPANTALIVIDMQKDFMEEGGYMSFCNPSFKPHTEIVRPISDLLDYFRRWGYHVIHTREGHEPNMMSLPTNKYWRSRGPGFVPGSKVPSPGLGDNFMMDVEEGGKKKQVLSRVLTRDYLGWEIIDGCKPLIGEAVIDKPTKGAFGNTEIEIYLNTRNIKNLVFTGVTTDVCVSTIMREANDRGFECILMEDCTASVTEEVKNAIIESVHLSNGIFGCTATAAELLAVLPKGESGAPYSRVVE